MPSPAVRIIGTGHYVPSQVRRNVDLEKLVDTTDEWIRERTGIRERRIAAEGELTSDMAANAAKAALEAAGVKASELDMIIVGTVTPDMPMPATAAFVQQKIGAGNCPAFDLSAACAGFIFGITIGEKFIRTGAARRILVVGVELLSRVVDWTDRTTCVLFGDGAGAVVLGPSDDEAGILESEIFTDGSLAESLWIPGGGSRFPASPAVLEEKMHLVQMKGQDIFKAAVKNLYTASKHVVEKAGLENDQVDWIVSHQANIRIIEQVTKRANYPREKVLYNLERVGNTSSASIPILLDESIRKGTIKPGDVVLMCALGAGVSWGASLVRI